MRVDVMTFLDPTCNPGSKPQSLRDKNATFRQRFIQNVSSQLGSEAGLPESAHKQN